jgi:hypothetical protein
MPRKSKTPPALARVIMERYPAQIAHLENKLHIKRTVPVECQSDHIKEQTEAEMVAFLRGYQTCLEDAMHEAKCYAGFNNYGPQEVHAGGHTARTQVREGDPDFIEWRRLYYTNGIAKA